MALEPGRQFGPYEVAEPIGSGGMGEVYLARDRNLKRDVALKVLPPAFVEDADRLSRFQREAEVLASLNHPNIATIYGLEKTDDQTVIVMELVDGPTLEDRIKAGPLVPDEAMGIAMQIVAALEAAHARNLVHRDLKPANVKVRDDGTVKVLDFGIAKPIDATAIRGGSPVAATPAATETGVILGTAAYMSPEQARGRFVDDRTDVWAFGCLLVEMLTGQPAFGGEDVMLTLARVLDRDTDLSSIPKTISPAVRHTIQLCLEKDPGKRIADIRDVRLALEGTFETAPGTEAATASRSNARGALAIGIAAAAILAAAGVWMLKPAPPPAPGMVTRFDHAVSGGQLDDGLLGRLLDVAPNGEFFVFMAANFDGLVLRPMNDTEVREIGGAQVIAPLGVAISPDSREVAYFRLIEPDDGEIRVRFELVKVAVNGGQPVVLASELDFPFGLGWEDDGTVLFGQPDGIWTVSDRGGTPGRIVEIDDGELAFGPQLLPGHEWLLFALAAASGPNQWNEAAIVVEHLTTGERRVLRQGASGARYLPSGHITYLFENDLYASTFDARDLVMGDDRYRLIQGVRSSIVLPPAMARIGGIPGGGGGAAQYAVSDSGSLVYLPGVEPDAAGDNPGIFNEEARRRLVRLDHAGNEDRLAIEADAYVSARISPDGSRIALVVGTVPSTGPGAPRPSDIYVYSFETGQKTRITFDPARDDLPVWSPDSSLIYFRSYRNEDGSAGIYVIPAEGGMATPVISSADIPNPQAWSMPDDNTLLLMRSEGLDFDIVALDVEQQEITVEFDDDTILADPSVSPQEPWLLYQGAAQPGQPFIYLQPYPAGQQQRRVGAGRHPVFSGDGSSIYYYDGQGISTAAVQYDPFQVSPPTELFRSQPIAYWWAANGPILTGGRSWDVHPGDDRILAITFPAFWGFSGSTATGDDEEDGNRISVVLNWFEELNERVPVE